MLLNVGFQHRIEMLKLSVSNQSNDKYLKKRATKLHYTQKKKKAKKTHKKQLSPLFSDKPH